MGAAMWKRIERMSAFDNHASAHINISTAALSLGDRLTMSDIAYRTGDREACILMIDEIYDMFDQISGD